MPRQRFNFRISAAAAALLALSTTAQAQAATPELTSEFVYKYLVGEIAGQRGDIGLASSLFYELAKSSRDPRMAERATQAAAYGNQKRLALRAANLWVELDPGSTEAQQALVQMLLNEGELNEALPHLQKLLQTEDTRANAFLFLNGALSRHKDKAAALKLVQKLAKPYQDLAEARFTVGHIAWNAGKDDLAIKELDAAEELRPGWELSAMLHGEILQRQSPTSAEEFYSRFLAQYPESKDVRLAYAKLLVNQKQFDKAREEFKQLSADVGNVPDMAVIIGLLAGQVGDYAQADRYFEQALEQGFKDSDRIYLYLGQSAEKQGKDDQALSWYRRVSEESEQHFDAQLRIAVVLARQNKLDEARQLLHNLKDLDDQNQAIAWQVEANLLTQAHQLQQAYDILQQAVSTMPNSASIVYDFAMLAEKLQRYDVMEQQLRKLIAMQPDFAQAYNALGYTLADRNERLDEAVSLIEKALSLSPDDHYILDSMGWVQYRLGKLDKAAEYLRRAYTVQTDPEIAAHLGEVLWQQGHHDEAIKTWDDALRAHPDNEALLNTSQKFRK